MKFSFQYFRSFLFYFLVLPYAAWSQTLVSKPFTGHTTHNEINAWCMFKDADTVTILLKNNSNSVLQAKHFYFDKNNCFKNYLPVNCRFAQLEKNTLYHLEYSMNGREFFPLIDASTSGDSIHDFSFLAGSCAFISTGFNGILKPFTSLGIFEHMKNDTADMMLWLGDNLYYVMEYHSYKGQLKRNVKTRLNPALNSFLQSKQQYAIWDDHDYGGNNSDGSFAYKTSSLNVFQQFWPNPKNDTNNYFTFTKEDCQFFMLDDRYHNENETIVLGSAQMEWLKKELSASTATFKFICMGMQVLNPLNHMECFHNTKEEYDSLISFIAKERITGIVFISGDMHHGKMVKVQQPGMYPLYDCTFSPLTMYPYKLTRASNEYINPYNVPGTYYPSYNYGKISISGSPENRVCIVQLKDRDGKEIWTRQINAVDLK